MNDPLLQRLSTTELEQELLEDLLLRKQRVLHTIENPGAGDSLERLNEQLASLNEALGEPDPDKEFWDEFETALERDELPESLRD